MENWPGNVNTDFYGLTTTVKDNLETVEFESGAKRTYLKNSVAKKTYTFSLTLWTNEEEQNFWSWYNDTILSGSLTFALTDLLTGSGTTEYRLTSQPSVSGQYPKELTLTVEEA